VLLKRLLILCALLGTACAQTDYARMLNGVNYQTGTTYTFTSADGLHVTNFNNAGSISATLPNGNTVGFQAGAVISVSNSTGSGSLTITCTGCTINGSSTLVMAGGQFADLYSDGLNYMANRGGTGIGGSPGGANTQLQFNSLGTFGAISNVAAGSLLASQGASSTPVFQTKPAIDVRDYGVDCTDTIDSTTAFANAVTAAGNFGKIIVPKNCKFKISGTPGISLYKVQGLEIEFQGRQGNSCDQGGSSGIDYTQAYAGGNTVFSVVDSQRLWFKNIVIYTNGGADNGLLLDQDGLTPPITTDNVFDNICIIANTATRNSSFRGISISPTSTSNVENINFNHAEVTCSLNAPTSSTSNGSGVFVGNSSNAVNELLNYVTGLNCSNTIGGAGGGQEIVYTHILDSTGTTNTNVQVSANNSGLTWSRFENSNIGASVSNSSPTGPLLIMGNDFTNLTTVLDCAGGGGCGTNVTVMNNEKDSVPANWFNNHANTAGNVFAVNNRNFSWAPLDWLNGAFVFPDLTNGISLPRTALTLPLFFTPRAKAAAFGQNYGSPFITFENSSGGGPALDDWVIQSMPAGVFGTSAASTFVINHIPNANVTSTWVALGGTQSGATFSAISTPTFPGSNIVAVSCSGGATWSYQVVAHGGTGTTANSATTSTGATACSTLTASNYLLIGIAMTAGCTSIDVYRTVSGGTPATTGKIGSLACSGDNGVQGLAGYEQASNMQFKDGGQAGDATSPPSTNTTGQIISTVATGLAPLSITSTTPVANLATTPTTYNHSGTQQTGVHVVVDRCTLGTNCAAITLTGSAVYTSSSSYNCTGNDETGANSVNWSAASGTTFTFTGTGTDAIAYICVGN
jgi:hypothetical protein